MKEVSFSVLMAENLSYLNSKSTAYNYEDTDSVMYPDENFSREVLQLYTIGICKLNQDGSEVLGQNGVCEPAYTNDETVEYSRVWTGFVKEKERGNIESMSTWEDNLIDVSINYYILFVGICLIFLHSLHFEKPLKIEKKWRDKFPKLGLSPHGHNITPRERLYILLNFLSGDTHKHHGSWTFKCCISCHRESIDMALNVIFDHMVPIYISLPTPEEARKQALLFRDRSGYRPNAWAAIDGTHIKVL